MFCPNCGTGTPDDSKFCESCGYNLQQSQQEMQGQAEPQDTVQQAPQTPPRQEAQQQVSYPSYGGNMSPEGVDPRDKVYGLGGWVLTYIVLFIPVVNIIMLFVWAFGKNTNRNKKNWAIATLIAIVIAIILFVIMYASVVAAIGNILNQMSGGW